MEGSTHQVSPDGSASRMLAEVNFDKQGLSEEEESKINDVNSGYRGGTAAWFSTQQQQLAPAPVVRWERILPVRTLKVLLVENDDSTRQVVSALLRNCSYEVTAAANGLQAWKILENPINHTDIILTEVVMPGLSGIGLLCKIMSHDTCKNIPVIMMSSNDSMGMVFRCLSRGAVDFLVKPIRKNELKNLWQHVWRRSHSSSGSVSESGIQNHKSAKSRSGDDSENNTCNNDDDDNASVGFNANKDGSDNGSGTQSSWTKHAVEVDSPQRMSPSDKLGNTHDSTCAQVIPESEVLYNKWVSETTNRKYDKQKKLADEYMGKDLEIGISRNIEGHHGSYPTEKMTISLPGTTIGDNQTKLGEKNEEANTKAADMIGGIQESSNGLSKIPESKEKNSDGSESPSLNLSLKRAGNVAQEDRNVLRRSVQSAFSRYRNSAASAQAPTGCVGSCSPVDNSSEAVKTDSTNNMISNSNPATAKQGSNGSSDNNDMGSTTKNVFTNSSANKEKATSTLVTNNPHPSAFHPVQLRSSAASKVLQEKTDNTTSIKLVGQPTDVPQENGTPHKTQLCGIFPSPVEGIAANHSINGSNSGSNHGSNPAVNTGGEYMECTNGLVDKYGVGGGNGNGSGSGSGSGVDQNKFARREAALNKFRQKRKERNFGKKVRYHSRQRLAAERPRVRGQFVRQNAQEHTSRDANS